MTEGEWFALLAGLQFGGIVGWFYGRCSGKRLGRLLERVSRRDTRPLLKTGDRRAILTRLMDERYPIYAEADMVIDSNAGMHESVVTSILDALQEREKNG